MEYTELHMHGYYSLMDGFNSPEEIVVAAKQLGHKAISLTDHGTLAGHRELQQACLKHGMKPVLGVEAYISPTDRHDRRPKTKREGEDVSVYNHIILQAKSQQGLRNLQAMSENAWDEGFYFKPRIDQELLEQYGEGLVVLSGCMNGLISKAIEREDDKEARRWLKFFTETFGEDFYVEVQPHNPPALNAALVKYAREYGVRPVVTNDCHFTKPEERAAEEIMLLLSTSPKDSGKTYADVRDLDFFKMLDELYPDRPISFAELDLYLKSGQQVFDELAEYDWAQEAVESTQEIVDKIGDYEYYEKLDLLPSINIDVPDDVALRGLCEAWLREQSLADNDEYRERMDEELKVIADLRFDRYFLIVADVIKHARSQDILVGPGRGSAAGSLVCYALGITDVDPIKYGLLFFRFLDPSRPDWPDIDMDFPDDRRGEVIDYMRAKYGNVANISTYGFFKDKGVIKSVARAFRVPYSEVEQMAKTFETFEEYEAMAALDLQAMRGSGAQIPLAAEFHEKYPLVLHFANKLRGKINTAGMHPAGVVVANSPIENYAPVEYRKDTSSGERIPAIVYDMEGAESVGLIKFDFLGLKTLAVVDAALKLAGLEAADLPRSFDDREVLDEFIKGNTVGVFQAEANPYTKLLRTMDDATFGFNDLVASNALVRPGAMNTVGKVYLARRAGREEVEYDHPSLESITAETYGVLIYQEQLMQTAVALGGFSMVEANKLRRIIGKKKDVAEFKPFEDRWMASATQKIGREAALRLWGDFQAHAGYSFNKSHAVAYSMLSYWTMWLKVKYPLEFLTAALGAEKKSSNNPKWSKLMLETKRLGIEVLLPHVNISEAEPTIHEGKLLLGLANIKYISDKVAEPLLAARPFENYAQLLDLSTTKKSGISTRVVGSLNALNAASFADNPQRPIKDNLYEYIGIPSFSGGELKHPQRVSTLDEFTETGAFVVQGFVQKIKRGKGWSRIEVLDETGTQGIFHDQDTQITEGSYYTFLVASNRICTWLTDDDTTVFARWLNADRLPGTLLLDVAERKTKAGKLMATAVFSNDEFRLAGALIFPAVYGRLKRKLQPGRIVEPFVGKMDDGGFMLKGLD